MRASLGPDALVGRVEQRRGAGHRDGHRVLLAEVLDLQLRAHDRLGRAAGSSSAGACPTDGPEPALVT